MIFLFRWAFDSAIRTKNTAIPFFGLKAGAAMGALVEEPAGISGHGFFFFETALGAFNNRR